MKARAFAYIVRSLTALLITLAGVVGISSSATSAAQIFTVTFHNNIPGEANISVTQSQNTATALASFATTGFSNPNFYFEDWATQQNGGGVLYSDQAIYQFSSDVELYAQWAQNAHSVTFFSNLTSTDANHVIQTSNSSSDLTSIGSLAFANPNFTFTGWNTQRNGGGVAYLDQAVYPFSADLFLYGQWSADQYSLSFSANTGTGSVATISAPYGSTANLPQVGMLSKPGYRIAGWNTNSLGSGTEYQLGAAINVFGNETLYATWAPLPLVVSFANPGVKGKIASISSVVGNPIHLRSASGLIKPGFAFAGWYSLPRGGRFVGRTGAVLRPSASLTLYAQWTSNPLVSLKFSNNGGIGHIVARQVRSGLTVVIPGGTGLHRNGYSFRGWATSSRVAQPTVRIGARILLTRTTVLYALWRHQLSTSTPQVLLGSVGIFASNSSVLTNKMRQYIWSLARGIDLHNRTVLELYGYATSMDSSKSSALLSLQRAIAVQKQLKLDLANLNDVGVTIRAMGEGRLSNSVLASFRNVEVFAN